MPGSAMAWGSLWGPRPPIPTRKFWGLSSLFLESKPASSRKCFFVGKKHPGACQPLITAAGLGTGLTGARAEPWGWCLCRVLPWGGSPPPQKAWRGGHVSKPSGFWILPQLIDWVKRGFSAFFFIIIMPRSAVWLCPALRSGGSAAPPRAQAPHLCPGYFYPPGSRASQ